MRACVAPIAASAITLIARSVGPNRRTAAPPPTRPALPSRLAKRVGIRFRSGGSRDSAPKRVIDNIAVGGGWPMRAWRHTAAAAAADVILSPSSSRCYCHSKLRRLQPADGELKIINHMIGIESSFKNIYSTVNSGYGEFCYFSQPIVCAVTPVVYKKWANPLTDGVFMVGCHFCKSLLPDSPCCSQEIWMVCDHGQSTIIYIPHELLRRFR